MAVEAKSSGEAEFTAKSVKEFSRYVVGDLADSTGGVTMFQSNQVVTRREVPNVGVLDQPVGFELFQYPVYGRRGNVRLVDLNG